MSKIEASRKLKMWKGSYDFAVDGGAVSTITLRSDDGDIPNGSVILGGYADVQTILASSGSATAALQAEAANDVVNAAAFGGAPWSTTGRKSIIPAFTGATTVKTTAARTPAVVIGTAALTGGKFDLVLFYH
jgi:hypothetical protein